MASALVCGERALVLSSLVVGVERRGVISVERGDKPRAKVSSLLLAQEVQTLQKQSSAT